MDGIITAALALNDTLYIHNKTLTVVKIRFVDAFTPGL